MHNIPSRKCKIAWFVDTISTAFLLLVMEIHAKVRDSP